MLDSIVQDTRFALRTLRRSPAFTAGALLTIALGIGGSTAIFSIVNTVALQPLPMAEGDRLVRVQQTITRPDGSTGRVGVSQLNAVELRERARSIESLVAHRFRSLTITGGAEPERVVGIQVSNGWLRTVGVQPVLGRGFTADEEQQGASARVAVIGHALWQRRFSGSANAIGASISLDGQPHTVVGVMPAGYAYPYSADLWVPLRLDPAANPARDLNVTARMRPGATIETVQRELDGVATELKALHASNRQMAGLVARPLRVELVGDLGSVLAALMAAVVFVLVIACVNVANLLLVRGSARQREFAIRAALGGSRGRQVRQLLTESVILAVIGGALGIAIAVAAAGAFTPLIPEPMRDLVPHVAIDGRLLLFASAVCVLAGLAFGAVPALRAGRASLVEMMKQGAGGTRGSLRPLHALVIAEIAVAVVLLTGGGLLLRDLERRLAVDTGVQTEGAVAMSVGFAESRYADANARVSFVRELERAASSLPGIDAVGMSTIRPFGTSNTLAAVRIEGSSAAEPTSVNHRMVTPGFFPAMGLRLLSGRLIDDRDVDGTTPVAVISEGLANRYWPGENALGKRIRYETSADQPWVTVVGVVNDMVEPDDLRETWYLPYAQAARHMPVTFATLSIVVVARGTGNASSLVTPLRRAVSELDPSLPIFDVSLLERMNEERHATTRLSASITSLFAALGLILAAIGIYAVVSFATNLRTREIGIRIAVGAQPGDLRRDVLLRALRLVTIGLVVGLAGAAAAARVMNSLLVEVTPHDPITYSAVVMLLAAVGLTAAYLPARRASRVDPLTVLRAE